MAEVKTPLSSHANMKTPPIAKSVDQRHSKVLRSGNGLVVSRAVQLCQNVSNVETLRLLHLL